MADVRQAGACTFVIPAMIFPLADDFNRNELRFQEVDTTKGKIMHSGLLGASGVSWSFS